jgi:hypothetical protein
MDTWAPPGGLNYSGSRKRHSSFDALSEVVSKQESVLQLPKLNESNSFLESLINTGLFATLKPSSTNISNTPGKKFFLVYSIYVRHITLGLPDALDFDFN